MDEAVLDHRGLRIDPHDLVGLRPIAGGGVHPSSSSSWISWVPEALSSIKTTSARQRRCFVPHSALQFRVVEALAHDVEQIKVLSAMPQLVHTLKSASSVAPGLRRGRLVGGIPALHEALEPRRQFGGPVAGEPGRLDEPAAQRRRSLLVLPGDARNEVSGGYSPMVRRICPSTATPSRSGCSASPRRRAIGWHPRKCARTWHSCASASAGNARRSQASCASTWPLRSSLGSCPRAGSRAAGA